MKRTIKKTIKYILVGGVFVAISYFFPIPLLILILCGVYDVSRNRGLDASVFRQYFLKNGVGTWLASPLNILLDIFTLPYWNKGVYKLDDLPDTYQEEIRGLLKTADESNLVGQLEKYMGDSPRAMLFFKWYGRDQAAPIEMPEFTREYRFVRTIGVSAFRERERTSRHFGPFRPSLRVLYCLNKIEDENAYIKVGPVENHWKDSKLFIFDDTLLHQSFNETDSARYVLFVDILRPSYLPFVFDFAVSVIRIFFKGINGVFYKNWKLVNN
ncbi:MAG: aspartyl/asparaginyl beta-hydroxylase domain-containing protein [Pyrinomonadaceae bacterium]